ncbi:MAG TPA: prepilin peptidase [Propionibacteriaceae bacterium]|nr:prepilin peptidase [Propionibacteriaceae bacterium]
MTVSLGLVALTGLGTCLSGVALRPWAARLAATESRWLDRPVVALLAALFGIGAAFLARSYTDLLAFAVLGVACALLVVIDLAAFRLPDRIVGPMYPVLFALLTLAAAIDGDWGQLGRSAAAGLALLVGYFALAYASPDNLGLGDVKLAGLLGAFLGWLGWPHVLLGTLAAFALSALCALALLALGRAHRHSDLAFGPWMVAGAALGAALGPNLVG